MDEIYYVLLNNAPVHNKVWYKAATKEACLNGISMISEYADFDKTNFVIGKISECSLSNTWHPLEYYHYSGGKEIYLEVVE